MAAADLTPERLRDVLHYDAETGAFTWAKTLSKRAGAGKTAGWIEKARGFRTIEIDGSNYKAHRLAWMYVHGDWPAGVIDHINGDPGDNRLENLRDVSQRLNVENRRGPNKGKKNLLGTHWLESRGRFLASIGVDRTTKFLGHFDTEEEAHQAYLAAKRRLHEGCTI